jgi:hypothetical protein
MDSSMRFSASSRLVLVLCALAVVTLGFVRPARAQAAPGEDDVAEGCFGAAERAQPLLRQKKLREARALLETCARDACPRVARTDCRQWLAEATDAQPSIIIAPHEIRGTGSDHGTRDLQGVRAVIDGALVIDRVDATPIVIDPGHHRLRLEREGAEPIVQEVDIHDGEKGRVVDVYWHVAVVVVPTRPIPPSVYVSGAVGIFATAVGTYFEISGFSQRHGLDTSCKPTQTCTQAQVDSARNQMRAGDLTIGGGLVFLASAAVLYFTRPVISTSQPADSGLHRPTTTAWLGDVPGGFVAGVRGDL